MLERRDTPANNYWLGVTSAFDNPANWTDGLPTADDQLYFVGSGGSIPTVPGTPPPPPGSNSNTGTTFLQGPYSGHYFPNSYAGIHLISGYTATVGIDFDITFGDYEHAGGATSTPGRNVTITGQFSWTGGTLNSSALAGEYRLQSGILGTANPDGNTVSLGSTFRIMQNASTQLGSTLHMFRGTYNLTNTVGFEVEEGGLLKLAPVPQPMTPPPPPTIPGKIVINLEEKNPNDSKGIITVKPGGECDVEPVNRPSNNKDDAVVEFKGKEPKLVNFGILKVKDRSSLRFLPDAATGEGGFMQLALQAPPTTEIEAGCNIICEGKTDVSVSSGHFDLAERQANGIPEPTQDPIKITAGNVPIAVHFF